MTVLMGRLARRRSTERGLYTVGMERQIADALSGRVRERVGDGRDGRTLRSLARAERAFARAIDQLDRDLWHFGHGQDRIGRPVARQDALPIEFHLLVQGPACRLDHAALDLGD